MVLSDGVYATRGGGEKEGHKIISFFQKISNGDVFFPPIFETYHDDVDEKRRKKKGKQIFFSFLNLQQSRGLCRRAQE